jgi:hypothetical protein
MPSNEKTAARLITGIKKEKQRQRRKAKADALEEYDEDPDCALEGRRRAFDTVRNQS